MDTEVRDEGDGSATTMAASLPPKLLKRIRLLEQQVSACLESQPLLYQVFSKCNALEQKLKVMKKDVDKCLAALVADGGSDPRGEPETKDDTGLVSRLRSSTSAVGRNQVQFEEWDDNDGEGGDQESPDSDEWHPEHAIDNLPQEPEPDYEPNVIFTLDADTETDTKPYECKLCDGHPKQLFDNAEGLAAHYSALHSQDLSAPLSSPNIHITPATASRTCPKCGKLYQDKYKMRRHLESMHSAPKFPCNICGHLFRRVDLINRHKIEVHGSGKKKRKIKTAPLKARVRPEPITFASDPDTPEPVAGSSSSTSANPNVEKVAAPFVTPDNSADPSKEQKQKHACPECGSLYGSIGHMKRHLLAAHGEPSFPCDICGNLFRRQDKVKPHQLRVHGRISDALQAQAREARREPLPNLDPKGSTACSDCGKSILNRNMRKHMMLHTGVRPYICEICGAMFRDKHDLHIHRVRTHMGLKKKVVTVEAEGEKTEAEVGGSVGGGNDTEIEKSDKCTGNLYPPEFPVQMEIDGYGYTVLL